MRTAIPFLLFIMAAGSSAQAQIEEITARVGAAPTSLSFTVAQVSLKKIAGVGNVTADVKSGVFQIRVNSGQSIRIQDVTDRLRASGFKDPVDLEITAKGKLEQRGNRLVLVVPRQQELFIVQGGDKNKNASKMAEKNARVKAAGRLNGNGNQYQIHARELSPLR